ncbi:MAG: ATP-binding protein, partial [Gemmatimonadetes bacterium]|nr:ATP-binding protein [Gemmatimonadota bacterium]MYE69495.1 ATP-binding protein [Gemmatimonadota bacterium]MYJ70115.1 ATP-binding protein [Gemmatimonadota bacterium]
MRQPGGGAQRVGGRSGEPVSPADRSSADAAGAGTLVFELPNDIAAIEGAVDHAVEHCAPAGLDRRRLLFNFRVGLTEAISNAILFGNSGDPDTRVRVELRAVPGEVRVRVSDQGDGFDPEAVPDPRLPENLLLPDGRGVFLMRALMDEVRFNRRGNEVTLVLREPPATTPPEVGLAQPVAETLEDFGTRLGLELRAWE